MTFCQAGKKKEERRHWTPKSSWRVFSLDVTRARRGSSVSQVADNVLCNRWQCLRLFLGNSEAWYMLDSSQVINPLSSNTSHARLGGGFHLCVSYRGMMGHHFIYRVKKKGLDMFWMYLPKCKCSFRGRCFHAHLLVRFNFHTKVIMTIVIIHI